MKIGLKKSKKQANPAVKGGDMGAPKFDLKNISRKRLLAYIGLAFLVVASAAWLVFSDNPVKQAIKKDDKVQIKKDQNIAGQVDVLNDSQTKQVAESKVDANKDVYNAYAKAVALTKIGNKQAAINEYKAIISTGKATYYMYSDYSIVIAQNGNPKLAAEIMQQAIDELNTNSSIDKYVKEAELRRLNNLLEGIKAEAS